MYVDIGTYIDLTHLNKKAKKKGIFSTYLGSGENAEEVEIGTRFVFLHT
jgi:hypothetical protein